MTRMFLEYEDHRVRTLLQKETLDPRQQKERHCWQQSPLEIV